MAIPAVSTYVPSPPWPQADQPAFKMSPSDLTFLWDECKRCLYNKINRGLNRPALPMPGIFNKIDGAMKHCFLGQSIPEFLPELPAGRFAFADQWVESGSLLIPGHVATLTLRGKFDTVLAFADGSYAVCDFKTIEPKLEHVARYSRQLHAYAYALENPGPGRLALTPVRRLGLLAWSPDCYVQRLKPDRTLNGYFGGQLHWIEIARDDDAFLTFLEEVLSLLELPEAPPSTPACPYCTFLATGEHFGW